MKWVFTMVLFLLATTQLQAQKKYRVEGKIIDFHNRSVIVGAEVSIDSLSTITNNEGVFIFESVAEGKYNLKAKHEGCEDFTEEIQVNKSVYLKLRMEHHASVIEEIKIHNHKNTKSLLTVSEIPQNEIRENVSDNLGNLLNIISGVGTLKTGNNITKPIINGLYGSRVLLYTNGVKMAEQEWGVEHAPSVDPSIFQNVKVVKGAGALKYGGDAIGGVVIMEYKTPPAKDTISGMASLSYLSNGEGGKTTYNVLKSWKNRWYIRSGGSFKKLGDLSIPNHTLQNTGSEEYSFDFGFGNKSFVKGFEMSYSGIQQNFGIYKGAHLGGPEDFYQALQNGQSHYLDNFSYSIMYPKQEVSHHILKLETYRRFEDIGKVSLHYSFQWNNRKEFDNRRGDLNLLPSMDMDLITHQVKLGHHIERENWDLESGVSGLYQNNYPNPITKVRRLIPDYDKYELGFYSIFNYKWNEKWKFEAGARYDYNRYDVYKYYDQSEWDALFDKDFNSFVVQKNGSRVLTNPVLNYHHFSTNIGLNFQPYQNLSLTLNASKSSRSPNAAELFADGLHHSASIIEKGDLSLTKEEVYQVNFFAKSSFDFLKGSEFSLNSYVLFSDSYINQNPVGIQNSNRGIFMIWNYQQVNARMWGMDIDARLHFTDKFLYKGQFSTVQGDDLKNNEPLILMMPTVFKNSVEWVVNEKNAFTLKFQNETHLNQNRYPIRNQMLEIIENGNVIPVTLDTSTPPSGYSIFHAGMGVQLFKNLGVNFQVRNLFNTEYRNYLNRLRYFVPENGRNFILTIQYQF